MIRVLGVDGGQSGIRLRHSAGDRIVEVEGVSRLEGDVVASVADAVARGWRQAAFEPVERVVLGLTTAPAEAETAEQLCRLVGDSTGAAEVWLADDAVTTHAGALSLGWGVSIAAGTGVACLAVPQDGEPRVIGGHGFLLGDEGGAFWIGRRGLNEVLRTVDGREDAASLRMLAASAKHRYGPLADLHVRLHSLDRPVHAIAQFAPDVLDAAEAGDPAAVMIRHQAARELLLLASAGAGWARGGEDSVPLALGGRLLADGTPLRRMLDGLLARPGLPVVARTADAAGLDGAILLGLGADPGHYRGLVYRWSKDPAG